MGILGIITEFMKKTFGSLNRFTLLQFLWVISIYYFVLNSLYKLMVKVDSNSFELSNINGILKYNELILSLLRKYENIWAASIVLLFMASMIVVVVSCTIFEDYLFIRSCSTYGGDLSIWSFIIYVTYKLYVYSGVYYIGILFLISVVTYWIKEKKGKFFSRYV